MQKYRKDLDAISRLPPEQYRVTQQGATEYPGSGEHLREMFQSLRMTGEIALPVASGISEDNLSFPETWAGAFFNTCCEFVRWTLIPGGAATLFNRFHYNRSQGKPRALIWVHL